jgi:hypothetical protein
MTLPNALQLLHHELEQGSLYPAAGEVPRAGDGTLSMFSIDEFLHMEIWFRPAEVVRTWLDWPLTEAWKAAKARPWQPPRGISKGWIRSLPPELYLLFGDVVDLLAFGPARLSIGLADLEERTARLDAGLALVGAASEGHVKLTGMPCGRNYPEAHILRHLGPRMPIEPEKLRDLVPVPFGGGDWLGPRRYAEDCAAMGHAP